MHDLLEGEVHPRIAVDKVSIERLAILELDQHGVALGGVEKAKGQLLRLCVSGHAEANVGAVCFALSPSAAGSRASSLPF